MARQITPKQNIRSLCYLLFKIQNLRVDSCEFVVSSLRASAAGHWSHACHAIASSCDGGSLVYAVKELLDRINRISAVNSKDFVHSVSIIRFLWRQEPALPATPKPSAKAGSAVKTGSRLQRIISRDKIERAS